MASFALPKALSLPWRHPEAQFMATPARPSSVRVSRSSAFIPIRCSFWDDEVEEDPNLYPNKYHEPVSLVTGASRGIGLEFTRQLLIKYPGNVVYGTARNPDASPGLQALKRRHPVRCELATMDVTKEESIVALAKEINEKYGRLDLIVHCAGIFNKPNELVPGTWAAAMAHMSQSMAVIMMGMFVGVWQRSRAWALGEHGREGADRRGDQPLAFSKGVVFVKHKGHSPHEGGRQAAGWTTHMARQRQQDRPGFHAADLVAIRGQPHGSFEKCGGELFGAFLICAERGALSDSHVSSS